MRTKIFTRVSALSLLATVAFSCSSTTANRVIDQRIARVENGLVPGASPQLAYQGDTIEEADHSTTVTDRMDQLGVPGVSIAVIDEYEVVWARGYGRLRVGTDDAVTSETLFEAASSTKAVTAILVHHFVDRGILNLDEDVNAYLKTWRVPDNELTQQRKVTLRMILSHQSGLNQPEGGFAYEEDSSPSVAHVLNGQAPALNGAAVVESVPGSAFSYSNHGYIAVQQLLEDVTGTPFRQLAEEVVFRPLGIASATLEFPIPEAAASRATVPHDGEGRAHDNGLHPAAVAHGGLLITPSDLARIYVDLMLAYRGGPGRILSQDAVQELFRPGLTFGPDLEIARKMGFTAMGQGVFIVGDGPGFCVSHPGFNAPGATAWTLACPESGKGAVIMTNSANGFPLSFEILASIVSEYRWPAVNRETNGR